MAIQIKMICVGKLKERFYVDAANEYLKRLSGYCKIEVVEIPEHGPLPDLAVKNQPGTLTVALCVEGREIDSPGLAELLESCALNGTSRLRFIIGGSNGLRDDVKDASDVKMSLSKMTFPHNLARVILLEQLYRAFNINEGGKYHK